MSPVRASNIVRAALALTILVAATPCAYAQAFVPAQGEGSVSFLYQDLFFRYHALAGRPPLDAGHINSRSMLFDVTYGVTDKIAVSLALPLVVTKYTGRSPHPLRDFSGPNPIDDGTWHARAQDFRFDVRYNVTRNLWNKGIVLTPYVGSILPSNDYPYFVHAGFGRNLRELQFGVSAAKLFERGIPGLLVQGRYGYGFVQQVVADVSHNRSVGSLEVAYFATPKLRVLGQVSGQRVHGGIDFFGIAADRNRLPLEQILRHDQLSRDNMVMVGGGVSYSLTNSLDAYASLSRAVSQRNGHKLSRGVSLGLSWSFTTGRAKKQNAAVVTTAEDSLARCLCEKGTK